MQMINFGRNIRLTPSSAYVPETEQEVLEILERHRGQRIRCIGRLHSWSRLIESKDVLLDLRRLNDVTTSDSEDEPSVHVGAGCQIKRLLSELERQKNWTLPSLGLITEQSVAGAVSTATHGSGRNSFCHYVKTVRIAHYDAATGKAVISEISEGDPLRAARCSLGSLGIIISVRLQCRSAYHVEESFHEYARLEDVIRAEEKYPQQQFYLIPWRWNYMAQHRREVSADTSRNANLYQWYRYLTMDVIMRFVILIAVRVTRSPSLIRLLFRHVIPAFVIRDWFAVGQSTPQLIMEHELFRHIELELFVTRSQLPSSMRFVEEVLSVAGGTKMTPAPEVLTQIERSGMMDELQSLHGIYCHHFPICVRKVLPDDALIATSSPGTTLDDDSSHSPWYAITFTCYAKGSDRDAFEQVGRFLSRSMATLFAARPHWGKLCYLTPAELRTLYPKFATFRRVCKDFDATGRFQNDWTEQLLGSG